MFESKRTKQISVILSYTWLFLATYLFNWKPVSIFIGFLMEMFVVLLLYVFFRIKAQQLHPSAFRKVGDLGSIVFAVGAYLFISFLMIKGISGRLDPDVEQMTVLDLILSKELIVSFISMFIIYLFQTLKLDQDIIRELVLRQNIMIKILAMSLTTLIPFLLIYEFELLNFLYLLPFVFLSRIIVELMLKDSSEE